MTARTFQTSLAIMCFAMVSIVAGSWTLEAVATVNEHQERQAEAVCQADPTACGLPR